jgi:hypothetical protein
VSDGIQQIAEGVFKRKALSQEIVDVMIERVRVWPDGGWRSLGRRGLM